jgi:amino acid transporter
MCIVSLGPMAAALGPASTWVWAGTAFIGGLQCLLLAELTSRFPRRAGGTPQFGYRAWPGGSASLGALSAWCYWFAWTPGIAVNLVLATTYLHQLVLPGVAPLPLALLIGAGLYALVASGLRTVALAGTALAVVAIGVLLVIVVVPAVHPGAAHWASLGPGLRLGGHGGLAEVAKWSFVASWSSYAAETASTVAAEVRGARRAMGKVMAVTGLFCLVACTLVPAALFLVAPGRVADDPLAAITETADRLLGSAAAPVAVTGVVCVLVLGALAFITSSSRTIYQLAEDRQLPRVFANVNRRGVPTGSVVLDAAVITTMLVVFGTNVVNVVAAANVGYLVVFILLPCAYLALRGKSDGSSPDSGNPDGTGGVTRLGRWAVPLAIGLAAFNLVLLVYGGSQWGWTVMTVGIGISLAIVPAAAWSRHLVRERAGA